jgi:hypothetical protein
MRHVGDQPFYEQPPRLKWDTVSGYTFERKWEGRADFMGFGFNGFIAGAQQAEFSAEGCKGTVIARYGNAAYDGSVEVPAITFTLRVEEITQSIFKHPNFSFLNSDVIKAIHTARDGATDYQASAKTIETMAGGPGTPASIAALTAFGLLLRGDESYAVSQSYTLTMTRTSSSGFKLKLIFANDGKIFTSKQLSTYTGTSLPWSVPQSYNDPLAPAAFSIIFGWRKRGSEVSIMPNGNVQLNEQWQSARWSLQLYSLAS